MITESTVYWVLKLDDIIMTICIFAALSGLSAAWSSVGYCMISTEESLQETAKSLKKHIAPSCIAFVLLGLAATFIPSTKQMAMIKVIPMIANSEVVGEMSADAKEIYKLGINAIKEQLTGYKKEHGK